MPAPADELPVNAFKRGLQAGKPRIGLRHSRFHSVAVEIVAGSGFDWLLPDTGHAPNDPFMVLSQLQAAEGGAAIPIVRMPWDAAVMIKRCLDMGVQASLVPFVQNAEEARALVATRFPQFSNGARGFASGSRASRYGRVPNYHQRAHEEMRLLAQAETRTALKEIEAIAAVPGIDGIFTGPGGRPIWLPWSSIPPGSVADNRRRHTADRRDR